MIKKVISILLLILMASTQATLTSNPTGTPGSIARQIYDSADRLDPQFIAIVNNYFGCKTWDQGVCIQCSQRFYFNENGVCCEVKEYCQQFNLAIGMCQRCYEGYTMVDGECVIRDLVDPQNVGCKRWAGNTCQECSFRYYFNQNRICTPVDDFCSTWVNSTGVCTRCYPGYALSVNGNCVIDQSNAQFYQSNLLCSLWSDRICLQCAQRAYFDQNGICRPVDDFCSTWDRFDGVCLTCYKGYILNGNSQCIVNPRERSQPADLGCATWDWDQQRCLGCSQGFFVNTLTGLCSQVDNLCRTYSNLGRCLTCYKGYILRGTQCIIDPSNVVGPNDLFCATWDWDNRVCLECAQRSIFRNNRCVLVSDQCFEYDSRGECTSCYRGYDLIQGRCQVEDQNNPDLGCALWDWENRVCLECSQRHYRSAAGNCLPVSDDCRTFQNGNCIGCYRGYRLTNGRCTVFEQQVTDVNCAEWDWANQVCLTCASDAYFNSNGRCITKDGQCRQVNLDGICTGCYKGYILVGRRCVINEELQVVSDLLCAEWDWDNQICLRCSRRSVKNSQGVCVPINDFCRSYDVAGNCVQCYKGYELIGSQCIVESQTLPNNLGCSEWDWDNRVCLACATRYYFGQNNQCIKVNDQCQRYSNIDGSCTSCYKGYFLRNGACIRSQEVQIKDTLCAEWDWDNQVCLRCSARAVFNSQGNCAPVSDTCREYDLSGSCISCYKGYDLENGVCILNIQDNGQNLDRGCSLWDWDARRCLRCSVRWYYNQATQRCQPVSDLCNDYDNNTGICLSCYRGYILRGGVCQISENFLCRTFGDNGQCASCYTGYALYRGECRSLDRLASLALYYAECCPEKLQQLRREGRLV